MPRSKSLARSDQPAADPNPAPALEAVAPPRERPSRKRLSRAEKAPDARNNIFAAAARVVGRDGYADASISKITTEANIAQGTFYLYFTSRQELFDELLPHVGADMLRFIRDRVHGSATVHEMEERGFRAFFEYLKGNPGFFRILNEAEVAAPKAFRRHFDLLSRHYVSALSRGVDRGEIRHYTKDELVTVAYMLMAARSYLYLRYVKNRSGARTLPEKAVQTYMRMVRRGLD
ncbi:TetR/AcrR family transcriptional regulator [Ramlibacter sp. AN1015]|uniref:TetR/AcrR family transcriptional regulator n=1 Tax=Ramlibacter sp. AN1015 TaxID=3133428 RepID=UPI0030BDEF1D